MRLETTEHNDEIFDFPHILLRLNHTMFSGFEDLENGFQENVPINFHLHSLQFTDGYILNNKIYIKRANAMYRFSPFEHKYKQHKFNIFSEILINYRTMYVHFLRKISNVEMRGTMLFIKTTREYISGTPN